MKKRDAWWRQHVMVSKQRSEGRQKAVLRDRKEVGFE
jgi:hypothetical protein